MRINHNIVALNTNRQIGLNTLSATKSMEKLSSGLRINRAGDDAAGLSVSEKMRSMIRGTEAALRNTQDGISFLQTAESALNEVSAMILRMKELTVQRANGTYQADDVNDIDLELNAITDEILNIHQNTHFNGKDVFEEADITIGHDGVNVLHVEKATLDLTLGLKDIVQDFLDDPVTNPALTVQNVEDVVKEVNTQRALYGALQNRLEYTYNNLGSSNENLQAAESRIRDVDMAAEMSTYTRYNILTQAAQSMLAQANQAPQTILQLLQ